MEFLLQISITAIATALFKMLVPDKKFSKQITLLIACIFVLVGINAISGAEPELDTYALGYEANADYISFSGEINRSLQKKICGELSDRLYQKLGEKEIVPEEIHVIVNISGLYSITISQVELVFAAGDEIAANAAAAVISDELPEGTELKIIIRE